MTKGVCSRIFGLNRLEGFKAAWDSVVFKGRLLEPGAVLEACGVGPGAVLVLVRQVLVPEGMICREEALLARNGALSKIMRRLANNQGG